MWNDMRSFYAQKLNDVLERRKNLEVGKKRNSSTPRKELDHFALKRLMAFSKFVIITTASVIFLGLITFFILTG